MADHSMTATADERVLPRPGQQPARPSFWLSVTALWLREVRGFYRQRARVLAGIATPLICNWPGVIKQSGAITDQVGHIIDLFPTIMDAAGVKYPKMYDGKKTPILPGKSLLPIFKGKERAGHEFLFWEHVGNKALRQGDWKLVAEHQGDWELYNLKTDRSELENLADQKPKKLKSLVSTWQTYADSIGVVDWSSLPQSKSKPSADYRRK